MTTMQRKDSPFLRDYALHLRHVQDGEATEAECIYWAKEMLARIDQMMNGGDTDAVLEIRKARGKESAFIEPSDDVARVQMAMRTLLFLGRDSRCSKRYRLTFDALEAVLAEWAKSLDDTSLSNVVDFQTPNVADFLRDRYSKEKELVPALLENAYSHQQSKASEACHECNGDGCMHCNIGAIDYENMALAYLKESFPDLLSAAGWDLRTV